MNRIYFFTGTGNSLHIAEEIAKALSDCEIIAIRKGTDTEIPVGYERIGFVFPTYGWSLPIMVSDFLSKARLSKQGNTYLFAVATCLGIDGNAIPQVNALLKEIGCCLNYGSKIRMFGNAVTNYNMNIKVDEITRKSDVRAKPVIQDIVNKVVRRIHLLIGSLIGSISNISAIFQQQTNNLMLMMIVFLVGYARVSVRRRILHWRVESLSFIISANAV